MLSLETAIAQHPTHC